MWNDTFYRELQKFDPTKEHQVDDQIDALSGATKLLIFGNQQRGKSMGGTLLKVRFNMPVTVKGKSITYEEVGEVFAKVPLVELEETESFVAGDYWQKANGWTGWTPESNSESAVRQFQMVERLFNAKNVCGGMVARIRGAALGKEPDWEIVRNRARDQDASD